MPSASLISTEKAHSATFEQFEKKLSELVARFALHETSYNKSDYDEIRLRQDFLDPLFAAMGWDLGNYLNLIQPHREVEIESRTLIAGRRKRADYLFRADAMDRFVCEAKKPSESLDSTFAFQAKRYAWNKNLPVAILSDFKEIKVYIVGGRPSIADDVAVGLWQRWHYQQYVSHARAIWDLFSRAAVGSGSIERALESLPTKPSKTGKARKLWLIKPDRDRALDNDFLNFLDETRRALGSDILARNDDPKLREAAQLNEAVQHILDRLLFLRICEDRDIDIGTNLSLEVDNWRSANSSDSSHRGDPTRSSSLSNSVLQGSENEKKHGLRQSRGSLWHRIVSHCREMDRRPPSHVPYFNGNLFKEHFSENLIVGDDWLAAFLDNIGADESPYLFNVISVEILGTIYERFLGKIIRPQGRGVTIQDKPEVREAGGVYYTPRYVVDYIVEQTVGKLLTDQQPKSTLALRFVDPACGSGSFLIRVFERVVEHWQQWLTLQLPSREHAAARRAWQKKQRTSCWVDENTGDVHLTANLKRQILAANIYGVDIDAGAVEVTQLSLYLKMLENENRNTLARERELFTEGDVPALLPTLERNIKCFNSLIGSDFSFLAEDLIRVRARDWDYEFPEIIKGGGFDAVIGNPPWGSFLDEEQLEYLRVRHRAIIVRMIDSFMYFTAEGLRLLKSGGALGMIVPDVLLYQTDTEKLRRVMLEHTLTRICNMGDVFEQVTRPACIFTLIKGKSKNPTCLMSDLSDTAKDLKPTQLLNHSLFRELKQSDVIRIPGALFTTANYGIWHHVNSQNSEPLSVVVDADGIQRGVSPDLKDAFLLDEKTAKEWQLEREKLRPVLTGGRHVRRYEIERPDLLLIYTDRNDDFKKLPRIRSFIDQFKSRITCKEVQQKKHSIYALHRARAPQIFHKPQKLVGVITEDEVIVALDTDETYVTDGLYLFGVRSQYNAKYIMGILNSRLFVALYRLLSLEEGRVLAQVKPTILAKLPIRTIDRMVKRERDIHDKIVELVDRMIALKPKLRSAKDDVDRATLANAVKATNQQLDSLVFNLYGIRPDEMDGIN